MKAASALLLVTTLGGAASVWAQDPWWGACPDGCECFANTRGASPHGCAVEVRCEEFGSAKYPTGYPEETECVGLSNPKLGQLSAADKVAMFAAMPVGLKLLDLSMCGLGAGQGLPAGAFGRFGATLRFLDLEFNRLTALPATAFRGLTALRTLWLTGNHFRPAEPGYAERHALGNAIAALDATQFAGLSSLQCLLVHHNKLTALPARIFEGTPMLRVLKLVDNGFAPALHEGDAAFAPLLARAQLPLCEEHRPSTGDCLQLDMHDDSGDALEDIWDGLGIGLADDTTVLAAPKDMPKDGDEGEERLDDGDDRPDEL